MKRAKSDGKGVSIPTCNSVNAMLTDMYQVALFCSQASLILEYLMHPVALLRVFNSLTLTRLAAHHGVCVLEKRPSRAAFRL